MIDPTVLTTDQLRREINALSEKTTTYLNEIRARADMQIAAIEKEITIYAQLRDEKLLNLQTQLTSWDQQNQRIEKTHGDAISAALQAADRALLQLKEVQNEKFLSIETQFRERDTRVEQTARDTKVAVDAALQAAEKAVGKQNESFALSIAKSETATTKQIDQLSLQSATAANALDGKIVDVKDRVARIENQAIGWSKSESQANTAKTTTNQGASIVLAAFAIVVSLAAIITQIVHFNAPK